MLVVWVLWGHSCLKSGNPLFFEFAHFEDRDECDNGAAAKIRDAERRYPIQMHDERGVMQGDSRELFFCTRQGASPAASCPSAVGAEGPIFYGIRTTPPGGLLADERDRHC